MTNPVIAGLLQGLRPCDPAAPANDVEKLDAVIRETVDLSDQLALIRARDRARKVRAAERMADLAEKQLAAQCRSAHALETIASLLASVIGVGTTSCAPEMIPGTWTSGPVGFIRTGDGNKSFACERELVEDDGEDE